MLAKPCTLKIAQVKTAYAPLSKKVIRKDRCDMQKTSQNKRVCALYRVSTKGQVDKNDIPMQKIRCREFAEQQGWEIVREVSELGVSGFKVASKDRDAIQTIQQDAALGKFDVLLVFMFDRLGRRDDETPFVVEWFVRNGIEVWSAEEGEQRFDNHVDKLMNYIRYWQASGESIKTSIRTKTRLAQIVQEGKFRGGTCPYGYRLEKQGRLNKKGHELNEIMVDETEALVVRTVFEKYVHEGYGAQRISRYLLEQGLYNRKGVNFANTTLIKMLKNIMYTGVLRSGETQSEVIPALQIIEPDLYERAQEIMVKRTQPHSDVPLNTKGKALLAGLVYCKHCGSKLILTTNGRCRNKTTGIREQRSRYGCHYKVRHPQLCDGQSGYGVTKLDAIVEQIIKNLFERIKTTPKEEMLHTQYENQLRLGKTALAQATERHRTKSKELQLYKSEVKKVIAGTSSFDMELLNELIAETKEHIDAAQADIENAQAEIDGYEQLSTMIEARYDNITTWADLFDYSTIESKKMIVAQLIKQIRIGRDYEMEIDLNVKYEMFSGMLQEDRPEEKNDMKESA